MRCRAAPSPRPIADDRAAAGEPIAAGAYASVPRDRSRGVIGGAAFAPGNLSIGPAVGSAARRIVDISCGPLQVRLAESRTDIDAAQALRYRIFYESLGARAADETARRRRDFDRFDEGCDHLLVLDHRSGGASGTVVGTYRLIRRQAAAGLGGFYSAGEYDLAPLLAHRGEILELGRSCVDAAYRQRPAMQLLWSGIAAYVFHYDIALMFGCASLPGIRPEALAIPLSYLHHYHLAPPALRPRALAHRHIDMGLLPAGAIDPVRARVGLPPLIKGYLRLGGFVGDGAVIDQDFNTTDVCIVVKADLVSEKYSRHYVRQSKDIKEPWARNTWAS